MCRLRWSGPVRNSAGALGSLYTPNASLTPEMREQIDQLINSAPPGITLDVVANAAIRMEAQLLGLPAGAGNPPGPQTAVVTNSEGVFEFRNLVPGRYQIRAQREGYFGVLPGGFGRPHRYQLDGDRDRGQPTEPVAMAMLRGAIISGRVRDPNGQALQTARSSRSKSTIKMGER